MAVNTILSSLALLCIFSSALADPSTTTTIASAATSPPSNGTVNGTEAVQHYLSDAEEAKVCCINTTAPICPTAGQNDSTCCAAAAAANGTSPKCVQVGVCSFVVVPINVSVPPSNATTTTAGTTTPTTTMAQSTTQHTTTPAPPPIIPEPNTVYVTDFNTSCIPSNFILIKACPNNGRYVFIYPCPGNGTAPVDGTTTTTTTTTTPKPARK